MMRRLLALLVMGSALVAAAPADAGEVGWRAEQPPPPPGAPFSGPVGNVADLRFLAPNFGLMMTGRATIDSSAFPTGLLVYDGASWRQLSTVCGSRDEGRIALVSGQEWWTVSEPATNEGSKPITLCRFRGGEVVSSHATASGDYDNAYARMTAAACTGPSDCWFAGATTDRPDIGTFFLRFDGTSLTRVVHPSARGIADAQPFAGRIVAGAVAGTAVGDAAVSADNLNPFLQVPATVQAAESNGPRLLRNLGADGAIGVVDWPRVEEDPALPPELDTQLVDLHAMDASADRLWIAGRGSRSSPGPLGPGDDLPPLLRPVEQLPFLATMSAGAAEPTRLEWDPAASLAPEEVITDIAALPGTNQAWVTLVRPSASNRQALPAVVSAFASLARVEIDALGAQARVVERLDITRPDIRIGDAKHIACPAAQECWMATAGGWIYHWSDPDRVLPVNTDPAIQRLISVRPPDARTPRDEPISLVADEEPFVAPIIAADAPQPEPSVRRIAALFRVIGKPRVVKRRYIEVRIQLRRRARVQLQGRRGGRVVARTKRRTLKPGRHTLRLRPSSVRRWPTSLRFVTTDLELPPTPGGGEEDIGGGAGDTVTTG